MKKSLLFAAISFLSFAAFSQVKMPAPSPTQSIKQEFATGSIELRYSRPSMKGRKIFGDLVPYGKLWRTGANAATSIKLTEPVDIMGKQLDTGSYVLYTIPGTDSWEVIFNKGLKNWGVDGYKESEDVLRVSVPVMKLKETRESFTMQFANVKPESCELMIMWDKTGIAVPFKANIRARLRDQIEADLKADKKPYWQAAQFYYEYEKNLPKALDYVSRATEQNPEYYWIWLYKAKIQKEMGDKQGAVASSTKSLELATADKNEDYIKLNKDLLKELK